MAIYIYGLVDPISGVVRYVGKSNDPEWRLYGHLQLAASGKKKQNSGIWLRSLKDAGLKPEMIILETLKDGDDWASVERRYIENANSYGWQLTNMVQGGRGGGYLKPEDKEEWLGRVIDSLSTPEVRKKISDGVIRANMRPEMKENHRQRRIKMWADPIYRERMANKAQEANKRPEVKARRVASGKKTMVTKEARAIVAEKLKAYYATEEGRQNKITTSNDATKRAKAVEKAKAFVG